MFARAAEEDPTIKAVLKDAILYKIDCEKGEGIELAERYEVRGYPTFKMVDARGVELERWIGYDGPEVWATLVRAGVADRRSLVTKGEAYLTAPTAVLARSLGNAAATTYDWQGAVDHFKAAADLDPAGADEYEESIVSYTFYGTRGDEPVFGLDDLVAVAQPAFAREGQTGQGQLMIASMVTTVARGAGRPEAAVPFLQDAMAATADATDADLLRSRARLEVDHALLVAKDPARAVILKKATLPEGWQDDAGRLNSFAWWCFENEVNLAEAEELALRGVELAADDAERATILDTAAEICSLRGDCDEAIARITRAIGLDPENGYYKEQLAKFEQAKQDKRC
ncbi:MAG: hypothetical protein ABR506_05985 [Candidatus Krumholzibacteriia bacterium]